MAMYMYQSGRDIHTYLGHLKYMCDMVLTGPYHDRAAILYDQFVTREFISGRTDHTFDQVGSSLFFNSNNIKTVSVPARDQMSERGRGDSHSASHQDNRAQNNRSRRREAFSNDNLPPGFPDHVCFNWNYKQCGGKCSFEHICRKCRTSNHTALECRERKQNK